MLTQATVAGGLFGRGHSPALLAPAGERIAQRRAQVQAILRDNRRMQLERLRDENNKLTLALASQAVATLETPWRRGSAVAVNGGTMLLTARHVVKGLPLEKSLLAYFGAKPIFATLRDWHPREDLAVLELHKPAPFALTVASTWIDDTPCLAMGFPAGKPPLLTFSCKPWQDGSELSAIGGPLKSGMSGGALIDAESGSLVGLVCSGGQTVANVVGLEVIRNFLRVATERHGAR